MNNMEMEAAIFFDPHLPSALRLALRYAGEDGFVASMPQLLHARANADYDNILWNTTIRSNTKDWVFLTINAVCKMWITCYFMYCIFIVICIKYTRN